MDSVPISEVRNNISALVERVVQPDAQPIIISIRGTNEVVLMSVREYERLKEAELDREIDSILDDFSDLNIALSDK